MQAMESEALEKARDQAAHYCFRQPREECQRVQELDHSFSHACLEVGDTTYVSVTVTYLFRCTDPGPPVVYTLDNPPPSSGPPEPSIPEPVPDCGGSYHYVADDVSELAGGCTQADRTVVEEQKARRLLEAAQDHASAFCAGTPDPLCRLYSEIGYQVTHHCFLSTPLSASYHTSSIVYFFSCPMTA